MKHMFSVFLGAASYGILSTIVVLSYDNGFTLGEVVGCQLLVGFLLTCLLALFVKLKERRSTLVRFDSAAVSRQQPIYKLSWKQKLLLMAAGTPTAITGLLYYHSLRYIPASLAIILLFQFIWIGVLIESIGKRRLPQKMIVVSLVVLFGGTFLAAGILNHGIDRLNGIGLGLGFLSAISYSLFILFSGKAVPAAHPAYRSMWMIFGAMLLVFVLFPPQFLWNGRLWEGLIIFGFLLGFFGAFIPPVLFAIGVPHIGEGMSSILGAAELPVAVFLSSVVLHEQVNVVQWLGVILILAGVTIPELNKRMRRPRSNAC